MHPFIIGALAPNRDEIGFCATSGKSESNLNLTNKKIQSWNEIFFIFLLVPLLTHFQSRKQGFRGICLSE
jgi:hypothetical protein